jgi:Ni/Fe-hydrogenase subunit HybB-like protein
MELTFPTLLAIVIALSAGIPAVFILGTRYAAVRLTGRSGSQAAPMSGPLTLPTIRFASWAGAICTLMILGLLAAGAAIILLRFVFGIGAVTNLSNRFAWGLWISFDVMSGVALAAGAFVLCAAVHIFGIKRFEPLVRPAILTGFLGYLLVVCGLVVDLGRPYNIWRPLVNWQHRSVLWEVGVCVATYTTVLLIEFLPVILERISKFETLAKRLMVAPIYRFLRRISIVFVILGVVLSTLHQSSLGSLWVLMPTKLDPLWYTIYLPFFFWLSAVAVGPAMVIVEGTLSAKAFKRPIESHLLADLGKFTAVVLGIYLVLKMADLVARGAWTHLFEADLQAASFWAEIVLGVIVPMAIFANRSLRQRPGVLFGAASLVVLCGIVLNRLNVGIIGLIPYTGNIYLPSWMEVVVTLTLVTAGVMIFWLAAKYLPVFVEHEKEGA